MSEIDLASHYPTWPDTPSVRSALDFARKHLDDPSYNHVVRSALFGSILASNVSDSQAESHLKAADKEIVVVAAILHDMAWNPKLDTTRQFISQDKRFEVDGANVARQFLSDLPKQGDWDRRRTQLVWDAIALHATASIAWYKEAEVAIPQYGILIDVMGTPELPLPGIPAACAIPRKVFDEIHSRFPSLQLAEYVKDLACALCIEKPETTYDNWVSSYGEEYVEGYTLKGKRLVDQMKAREQAEK